MQENLTTLAAKHIHDIITIALEHKPDEGALVVYDTEHGLTKILTEGYRRALPSARFLDFNMLSKEEIIAECNNMRPGALVVLIQSSSFRLDAFRIRLHLFQKKLKVIEHMHLHRNSEAVWDVYINALEYDPSWYRVMGPAIAAQLEATSELTLEGGNAALTITGGVESPKLNVGDYTGMEHIGGTFPIGEVFTEAKNFTAMNGSIMIYAYAGSDFSVTMQAPFRVEIQEGIIAGWADDAPAAFTEIIEKIREHERPLIREIGFGLNRAITRERYVEDITAFERIYGMHLSLGEKHGVYKKPGISADKAKFHVDIFPVVDRVLAGGKAMFENGKYVL